MKNNMKKIFWENFALLAGLGIFYSLKYFFYDFASEEKKNEIVIYYAIFVVITTIISFIFFPFLYAKIKKKNHKNLESDVKRILKNKK